MGAATGLIVTGFNHVVHKTKAPEVGSGESAGAGNDAGGDGDGWTGYRQGGETVSIIVTEDVVTITAKRFSYVYNDTTYNSKISLFFGILVDQTAEQFGIKDIVALAAGISGYPLLPTRGKFGGAIKGTSINSIVSRNIKTPISKATFGIASRVPTLVGGPLTGKALRVSMVNTVGKLIGRSLGPIGWGVLTYDVGKTIYDTISIYNQITD